MTLSDKAIEAAYHVWRQRLQAMETSRPHLNPVEEVFYQECRERINKIRHCMAAMPRQNLSLTEVIKMPNLRLMNRILSRVVEPDRDAPQCDQMSIRIGQRGGNISDDLSSSNTLARNATQTATDMSRHNWSGDDEDDTNATNPTSPGTHLDVSSTKETDAILCEDDTARPVESFLFAPCPLLVRLLPPQGSVEDAVLQKNNSTRCGERLSVSLTSGSVELPVAVRSLPSLACTCVLLLPVLPGRAEDPAPTAHHLLAVEVTSSLVLGTSAGHLCFFSDRGVQQQLVPTSDTTWHSIQTVKAHDGAVLHVSSQLGSTCSPGPSGLQPAGRSAVTLLVSLGEDAMAVVWDATRRQKIRSMHTQLIPTMGCFVSGNSNVVIVALRATPPVLRMFSVSTGLPTKKLELSCHATVTAVSSMWLSSDVLMPADVLVRREPQRKPPANPSVSSSFQYIFVCTSDGELRLLSSSQSGATIQKTSMNVNQLADVSGGVSPAGGHPASLPASRIESLSIVEFPPALVRRVLYDKQTSHRHGATVWLGSTRIILLTNRGSIMVLGLVSGLESRLPRAFRDIDMRAIPSSISGGSTSTSSSSSADVFGPDVRFHVVCKIDCVGSTSVDTACFSAGQAQRASSTSSLLTVLLPCCSDNQVVCNGTLVVDHTHRQLQSHNASTVQPQSGVKVVTIESFAYVDASAPLGTAKRHQPHAQRSPVAAIAVKVAVVAQLNQADAAGSPATFRFCSWSSSKRFLFVVSSAGVLQAWRRHRVVSLQDAQSADVSTAPSGATVIAERRRRFADGGPRDDPADLLDVTAQMISDAKYRHTNGAGRDVDELTAAPTEVDWREELRRHKTRRPSALRLSCSPTNASRENDERSVSLLDSVESSGAEAPSVLET